ncbi:MAG: galactokinase, partial [Oligoflexia bacterium]|nr:galactokinase [Oligoflexia bacterium]
MAKSNSFVQGIQSSISYKLGEEENSGNWGDYVKGVTKILKKENFKFSGFKINVESTVPIGSGLSSSAALTVALMRAMAQAFQLDLSDLTIAKLGQRVENEFVGARVGIMDPMVISVARNPGKALYIDTATLHYETVDIPNEAEIVVINSGVSHSNRGGGYLARRRECEEVASLLKVEHLSKLNLNQLN